MANLKFKRVLLKLSGEALAGEKGFGIDSSILAQMAAEVVGLQKLGAQVGIVIGGGNIVRGISASAQGVERTAGDQMGMLATVINCIAMQDALEKAGATTMLMSAFPMGPVCETFSQREAVRQLQAGNVVLFGAGTGNPYFTTDTAATLRAIEIHSDVIVKATKVDGIYDSDPKKNPNAVKFDQLTHVEAIARDLKVMDTSALALCRDNNMPILVCQMGGDNLARVLQGEKIGTLVTI